MQIQSWQIYHVARKKLPRGMLQKIYRRSSRLIQYWAADPKYVDKSQRNPRDRIRDMLEQLDLLGFGEYARAAIDYMAEPLGGRFEYIDSATTDKGTIDGELTDITIAFGRLADHLRIATADGTIDPDELITITNAAREMKQEIEQLLDAAGVK